MDIFRTLIIPANQVEFARAVATSFGSGGQGMWTTPLSSTGLFPATHYISSGYIAEEFAYMVPEQFWEQSEEGWVETGSTEGNPEAVYQSALAGGVECSLEDIQTLFAVADVTEQDPFVAMGRLKLIIINIED